MKCHRNDKLTHKLCFVIGMIFLLIPAVSMGLTASTVSDSFTDESKIASYNQLTVDTANGWVQLEEYPNLVANPDVESGSGSPDNWNTAGGTWDTTESRSSSHSLKLDCSVENKDWRSDYYAVSSATDYIFQAYIKGTVNAAEWFLTIRWFSNADGTGFISEDNVALSTAADWTLFSDTATSPGTAQSSDLLFRSVNGDGTMYADDFSVQLYPIHYSTGIMYSINLLSGLNVSSILSFSYNCSIAGSESIALQFSQDNATWYNATDLGGWNTLQNGTATLTLTTLGWDGGLFYYRANYTRGSTPELYDVTVTYEAYTMANTGFVLSTILLLLFIGMPIAILGLKFLL